MTRIMFILGIALTVLSIFISFYAVNNNQEKINSLRSQISESEDKINQFWKKQQELEQRHAVSIMLYALVANKSKDDPIKIAANSYVADTLEYYDLAQQTNHHESIKLLPKKLKTERAKTINYINDIFAHKLTLSSSTKNMYKTNEIYKIIGLLMHITGLILVLYFKP